MMTAVELLQPGSLVHFGRKGGEVEQPHTGEVTEISIMGKDFTIQYHVCWWDNDGEKQETWLFSHQVWIAKQD